MKYCPTHHLTQFTADPLLPPHHPEPVHSANTNGSEESFPSFREENFTISNFYTTTGHLRPLPDCHYSSDSEEHT